MGKEHLRALIPTNRGAELDPLNISPLNSTRWKIGSLPRVIGDMFWKYVLMTLKKLSGERCPQGVHLGRCHCGSQEKGLVIRTYDPKVRLPWAA